jgi:hypothetical protein
MGVMEAAVNGNIKALLRRGRSTFIQILVQSHKKFLNSRVIQYPPKTSPRVCL